MPYASSIQTINDANGVAHAFLVSRPGNSNYNKGVARGSSSWLAVRCLL